MKWFMILGVIATLAVVLGAWSTSTVVTKYLVEDLPTTKAGKEANSFVDEWLTPQP